jgi:four helix bundle protein
MGVRDFQELVAWQLSHQLKCEVFEFTSTGPASRDFKYRDQIRDSSASGPSNISEGFGRFRPQEFARFLEFAKASLAETRNHLIDGRDRKYLAPALFLRLLNLATAAERTTTRLLIAKKRQADRTRKRGKDIPGRERRTLP